jgi:glycosyltransferase involved in cell wall biosynthesis
MEASRKEVIGILTLPIEAHRLVPVNNLVTILLPLANVVHIITGSEGVGHYQRTSKVCAYGIVQRDSHNAVSRILRHVVLQWKMALLLCTRAGKVSTWFFFIGGEIAILPMIVARATGKRVFLILAGSPTAISVVKKDGLHGMIDFLSRMCLALATRIIVYSERVVNDRKLHRYSEKTVIGGEHIVDTNRFRISRRIEERGPTVGYLGGISEVKGVGNLVQAIPLVLAEKKEVLFMLGGEATDSEAVSDRLGIFGPPDRTRFVGWIPHDDVPTFLNELEVLVLPSATEGLPNLILEAMACGTPVLATPVGAIPDFIRDGETGFIMDDSSPESIARNVLRVLGFHSLGRIVENARNLVEQEFSYSGKVDFFRELLYGD